MPQLFRVPAGVEDRQNHDTLRLNEEVNHKGKTVKNNCTPHFALDSREGFRILGDAPEVPLDLRAELLSQALALAFIPPDGIVKFPFGDPTKNEAASHRPYLASSLALTSSNETTASGLAR